MKERPILFSGAMVRAILEGRKTQTRRVEKLADNVRVCDGIPKGFLPGCPDGFVIQFPYGKPGDRLWVRECWTSGYQNGCWGTIFKADSLFVQGSRQHKKGPHFHAKEIGPHIRWRPSIHMPRWASRLTLEIVKVRVERLQEISEEDAKAEGVDLGFSDMWWQGGTAWTDERNPAFDPKRAITGPRAAFGMLWNSINSKRKGGKYAWDKNPWVWVIEFKRLEAHVS